MESHNLLEGNDFIKLQQKAKELGAKYLEYSKRKNSKYVVTLSSGKKIHFGSPPLLRLSHPSKHRPTKKLSQKSDKDTKQKRRVYPYQSRIT